MSRPASSSRFRRYSKAAASVVMLVLIAAACSSDGFPESYADQPNSEGVSNVQQNWLDGCTVGLGDSDLATDANTVCECSYNALSADVADGGIPFEDFVELNNDLKGDPQRLGDGSDLTPTQSQLLDIVKGCIAGG